MGLVCRLAEVGPGCPRSKSPDRLRCPAVRQLFGRHKRRHHRRLRRKSWRTRAGQLSGNSAPRAEIGLGKWAVSEDNDARPTPPRRWTVLPANLADWTAADYDRAAAAYCASLPLEHFMEATPQGAQRAISLASLQLIESRRRDFHVFNELLVQYPINKHLGQVVPDNMVVRSREKPEPLGSYNLPFEPAGPYWVLEYVSPSSKRKDYEDNFRKYERELQVPYYLVFYPEKQDLRLYRHTGVGYEPVGPNAAGRLPLRELRVEVALVDGWVRFWDHRELVPLPAELEREVNDLRDQLDKAREQAV